MDVKTIWVRLHKNSRLIVRYAKGRIEGRKIKPPGVLLGVHSRDGKAYISLTSEEALRLAETLRLIAQNMIKEETALQVEWERMRASEKQGEEWGGDEW